MDKYTVVARFIPLNGPDFTIEFGMQSKEDSGRLCTINYRKPRIAGPRSSITPIATVNWSAWGERSARLTAAAAEALTFIAALALEICAATQEENAMWDQQLVDIRVSELNDTLEGAR